MHRFKLIEAEESHGLGQSVAYLYRRRVERCFYCARKLGPAPAPWDVEAGHIYPDARTFEHMTPRSRGGSDEIENIVIACWGCNEAKGTTFADEFLVHLGDRASDPKFRQGELNLRAMLVVEAQQEEARREQERAEREVDKELRARRSFRKKQAKRFDLVFTCAAALGVRSCRVEMVAGVRSVVVRVDSRAVELQQQLHKFGEPRLFVRTEERA